MSLIFLILFSLVSFAADESANDDFSPYQPAQTVQSDSLQFDLSVAPPPHLPGHESEDALISQVVGELRAQLKSQEVYDFIRTKIGFFCTDANAYLAWKKMLETCLTRRMLSPSFAVHNGMNDLAQYGSAAVVFLAHYHPDCLDFLRNSSVLGSANLFGVEMQNFGHGFLLKKVPYLGEVWGVRLPDFQPSAAAIKVLPHVGYTHSSFWSLRELKETKSALRYPPGTRVFERGDAIGKILPAIMAILCLSVNEDEAIYKNMCGVLSSLIDVVSVPHRERPGLYKKFLGAISGLTGDHPIAVGMSYVREFFSDEYDVKGCFAGVEAQSLPVDQILGFLHLVRASALVGQPSTAEVVLRAAELAVQQWEQISRGCLVSGPGRNVVLERLYCCVPLALKEPAPLPSEKDIVAARARYVAPVREARERWIEARSAQGK